MDLSVFSPVCLPDFGDSFLGQNGTVCGEQSQTVNQFIHTLPQAGETLELKRLLQISCKRL